MCLVTVEENGHQQGENAPEEVAVQPTVENLPSVEDEHQQGLADEAVTEEAPKQVNEESGAECQQTDVPEHTSDDKNKLENAEEKAVESGDLKNPEELIPSATISHEEVASLAQNEDTSEAKSMSRKMEVPNNKVDSRAF